MTRDSAVMAALRAWGNGAPFLDWIRVLKNPAVRRADITAGVTVALVLVPQSMAYAQLAGLPAHYGLYGAFTSTTAGIGTTRTRWCG